MIKTQMFVAMACAFSAGISLSLSFIDAGTRGGLLAMAGTFILLIVAILNARRVLQQLG